MQVEHDGSWEKDKPYLLTAYVVKVLDKQMTKKLKGACDGHHNDVGRKGSDEVDLVLDVAFAVEYEVVEYHVDHSVDEEEAGVDGQVMD